MLGDLGELAASEGDFDTAEALYRRALEAARALEKKEAIALCLAHLARVTSHARRLGSRRGPTAWTRSRPPAAWDGSTSSFAMTAIVGDVARQRGELDEARRIYSDAVATARKVENRQSLLYAVYGLGLVELDAGDALRAAPLPARVARARPRARR